MHEEGEGEKKRAKKTTIKTRRQDIKIPPAPVESVLQLKHPYEFVQCTQIIRDHGTRHNEFELSNCIDDPRLRMSSRRRRGGHFFWKLGRLGFYVTSEAGADKYHCANLPYMAHILTSSHRFNWNVKWPGSVVSLLGPFEVVLYKNWERK